VKRRQLGPSFCDRPSSSLYLSPARKRITTKFWSPIGLYCVNCTRFGQLILRRIIKIVATRCHIFVSNAPNSIPAGASPQTALGELTALPRPSSCISGVLLLRRAKGIEGRGEKGRPGRRAATPQQFFEMTPLVSNDTHTISFRAATVYYPHPLACTKFLGDRGTRA